METISIITIISIAFLGSFGHCVGMCGGIVIAYSSTKIKNEWTKKVQALAHLLYSFGRISTYMILGALFGFVGGVVTFDNLTSGIFLLITGLMMVLVGLSLLGKIKFLTILEHSCSKSPLYQSTFKSLLLPCGFVYVFAITAASTGSAFWGAFVMLIFGLSTVPALFSLGFFVGLFKQSNLRDLFIKLASILVIAFGFYIGYLGYQYLIDPTKSILSCHI